MLQKIYFHKASLNLGLLVYMKNHIIKFIMKADKTVSRSDRGQVKSDSARISKGGNSETASNENSGPVMHGSVGDTGQ